MRYFSLLMLVCLFTATSVADAQEWTRFRGPNGSGAVEDDSIPAIWTEANIDWKAELPGTGHSSPVVWGDKVFLLSADSKTAERHVVCVSAADGKLLWENTFAASKHPLHSKSSYASSTPAVDADRVYVAWSDPEHTWFCAFDHLGAELWRQDLGGWIGQHGFGMSPIVVGDQVVLTSSQEFEKREGAAPPKHCFVVAVDRKTGEIQWKTPRGIDTASYSVPCVRKNKDGQEELILCSTAEGIFALHPTTGKQMWSSGKVFSMRTVSSPVLWKDLIYGTTGSGGGGNYAVAYRPGDAQPAYEIKKEMPYVPTPVAYEDLLFFWSDGGIVTCVQAGDGQEIWQKRVGGKYSGSPVRAGKKIFCVDEEGTVVVLAAEREFKELGRNKLGEKSHSTPAISGGKIYVRTISHLHCIGGKKS